MFCGARTAEQIASKTMLEKLLQADDQRIVFISNTTSLTEEVAKMKKRSHDITIDTQTLHVRHIAHVIDARGSSVLTERIAEIPGLETAYYMPDVAYRGIKLPMEVVAGRQVRFSDEEKKRLWDEGKLSVEWSRARFEMMYALSVVRHFRQQKGREGPEVVLGRWKGTKGTGA